MKNLFDVSIKNQVRKKYTLINSIFLALTILFTICFSSYNASLQNHLKNDAYDLAEYNTFLVSKSIDGTGGERPHQTIEVTSKDFNRDIKEISNDQGIELSSNNESNPVNENQDIVYTPDELNKQKSELLSIENVVNVSNSYAYWTILKSNDLKKLRIDGEIGIYSATNKSLPEIILGTNFPSEEGNYLICPENFYPDSNIQSRKTYTIFDKINIKKFLNKNIIFPYYSVNQSEKYEIEYKIVGFYKNNTTHIDENICYANNDSLIEIAINEYSDDIDPESNINNIVYQTDFFVQIDRKENITKVQEKLAELGYYYKPTVYVDEEYVSSIESNVKKTTLLVILLGFIVLILVLYKQFVEEINNYTLLFYLGYNKNKIRIIFVFSTIIQIILSLIMSVIISLLLLGVVILGLNIFPFILNKWKLCIDISSTIFVFIMVTIAMFINIIIGSISIKRNLI